MERRSVNTFLYVGNFFVHFLLLPAALTHEANTLVKGLHYVLICFHIMKYYLHCIHFIFCATTYWPQL
jgi:hypothetical protein